MDNGKRLVYAEDVLAQIDRDRAYMTDVGRIHARAAVNSAETVDAKPVVHGRWDIRVDDYDCEYAKCSACGEEFYDANEDTIDMTFNYCPNCGADMRGAKDG